MTRYYGLDQANERLGELEPILLALREQRSELVRLRDRILASSDEVESPTAPESSGWIGRTERPTAPGQELQLIRLRMQGLIDQMQAGVARLDELDVALRDIESGLIDFPALVNGRQVWLCWKLGELSVGWWHELDAGVAGRRLIAELE